MREKERKRERREGNKERERESKRGRGAAHAREDHGPTASADHVWPSGGPTNRRGERGEGVFLVVEEVMVMVIEVVVRGDEGGGRRWGNWRCR